MTNGVSPDRILSELPPDLQEKVMIIQDAPDPRLIVYCGWKTNGDQASGGPQIYLNPAARGAFGLDIAPDGDNSWMALDKMGDECAQSLLGLVNMAPENPNSQIDLSLPDGRVFRCQASGLSIEADGSFEISMMDVTDLVVQNELARKDHRGALLLFRLFLHDVATIVSSLSISIPSLSNLSGERFSAAISRLTNGAKRLTELVHLYHQLTQVLAGTSLEIEKDSLDHKQLGDSIIRIVNSIDTPPGGIRIETSVAEIEGNIAVNQALLDQIIENLVRNAVKHAECSEIKIDALYQEESGQLVIKVSDNGRGILPNLQDTIFEPGMRGNTQSSGQGLGLYIVETLAQAHGGDVQLESTPGQGTVFTVTLQAN